MFIQVTITHINPNTLGRFQTTPCKNCVKKNAKLAKQSDPLSYCRFVCNKKCVILFVVHIGNNASTINGSDKHIEIKRQH